MDCGGGVAAAAAAATDKNCECKTTTARAVVLSPNSSGSDDQFESDDSFCVVASDSSLTVDRRDGSNHAPQRDAPSASLPSPTAANFNLGIRSPTGLQNLLGLGPPRVANTPRISGPCRKCPTDLKLFCRLIAFHDKNLIVPSSVAVSVDNVKFELRCIENVDIGQNIKCLVFRQNLQTEGSHVIFAFNWFSPRGIVDYIGLGFKLLTSKGIDAHFGMCGRFYMEKAEEFLWHSRIRGLVRSIRTGIGDEEVSSTSRISVCGFSMGGGIAHAFAYLLLEECNVCKPVRVVGIGSSRPGTSRFNEWFLGRLQPDSMNVVMTCEESLASPVDDSKVLGICTSDDRHFLPSESSIRVLAYDPVSRTPPLIHGFDLHPRLHLLLQKEGTIMPIGTAQIDWLIAMDNEYEASTVRTAFNMITRGSPFGKDFTRLWDKLHSIVKYYESMCGLGE